MVTIDEHIEDALKSMPLQSLPAGFTGRVMLRVQAQTRLQPRGARPKFRLEFVDITVPAFLAFFLSALVSSALWLWQSANPLLAARIQLWLRHVWLQASATPVFPLALVGLVGLGFCITGIICFFILVGGEPRRLRI